MNFKEFIQQHESNALKLDIQKIEPLAYREYLGKKLLLENADFESEKKEVLEEIKNAVTYFKKHILNFIKNNIHCKVEYIGKPAPYIMHLRFYLMYKELHSYKGELSQKPELSLRQVALLYIYNGDHITTENNDAIAKEYLYKTGHKLQQHYNDYHKSNSRKSFSKRKDSLLLKDIEKIINYLPIEKQDKPKKEAELLRNIVQNNDYTSL